MFIACLDTIKMKIPIFGRVKETLSMRFIRAVSALLVLVLVSISLGCEAKAKAATKQTSVPVAVVHIDREAVSQAQALSEIKASATVQPDSALKLSSNHIGRPVPETVARE